jgi:hypothetical protein
MIQTSPAFLTRLKAGELPEVLAVLENNTSRWIFGKTVPSIASAGGDTWDGSRLVGEGTFGSSMGLVGAGARVLTFGSITSSIAYSNKDFLISFETSEIGSLQVILDNGDEYFSDLLGKSKGVSFLNSTLQVLCGFPGLDSNEFIEFFNGVVTEETLSNTSLKILAQAQTSTLLNPYILPKSGRYATPKNTGDALPTVYGNTAQNSSQGVSVCPCIDTVNHVHCLACHALPSGATIALYADNELISSGYSVTNSVDYESQGIIAIVTFTTEQTKTITMTTTIGKDSLTNPIDIMIDILDSSGDATVRNSTVWATARRDAESLEYVASSVMASDNNPAYWMRTLLSSFLGSWYLNNAREIVISLDSDLLSSGNVAGILSELDAKKITGTRSRGNVCNQVAVNYAYTLGAVDRRYKQDAVPNYLAYEDGESTKDPASQLKHGTILKTIDNQWCRDDASIAVMQERIIARYKNPVYTLHYPLSTFDHLVVEPGDFVAYSWEVQRDENDDPIVNQIARVLSVTRDFDAFALDFDLIDYGEWLSTDPYVWDGTHLVGEGYFGYTRDRRDV